MPENTNQQNISLQDKLIEASTKEIEKQVKQKTADKLQSGMNPQDILNQLINSVGSQQQSQEPQNILKQVLNLAETQIPTGERVGLLTSLKQGAGLSRPEITQDLGINDAIKIIGLKNQVQRSNVELPKQQVELLNSLVDLSQKVARFNTEGEQIERDITGQPTTKGIQQQTQARVTATKQAEDTIKKEQLKKDLGVYFDIAQLLPTGEGLNRFKVGVENFAQSITQKTPTGVAASRLKSLNKRLRVTLVRAAGDVGNLNIVEQKAAEELLFKLSDSTQERSLKKAVLQDLTRAIKEKDTAKVKFLINTWMNKEEFGKPQEQKKQKQESKETKDFTLDNVLEGL